MHLPNPKISIIVPVYNSDKYLRVCLDSLVNQSLDYYEVIVVNDGSQDNSQSIIDEFAIQYPSIIKSYIKDNGGVSDARNFGLSKVSGEYIGFVDSDDCIRKDMLELMYSKAKSTDSDITVCSYSILTDKIEEKYFTGNEEHFGVSVKENPEIIFECKPYLWNKIYRSKFWEKYNFRFPLNQWFEDDAIIYSILYSANKITAVPECLYYYRKNNELSITNTVDKRIYDVFKACDSIVSFFSKYSDDKNLMQVINRMIQIHLFVRLKALTQQNNRLFTLAYYLKAVNYLDKIDPDWRYNKYLLKDEKKKPYKAIRKNVKEYTLFTLMPESYQEKHFGTRLAYKPKNAYCYINNKRLRDLQMIELKILKDIDRVCKAHNLTYYLSEDTLLGAIRHKGFIPWDDRLDISMPRADYEKFLEIADNSLSEGYELLNETKVSNYYRSYSKVVSLENHGFVNVLDLFPEKYNGPYVDVCPIDGFYSDDEAVIESKLLKINNIKELLLLKAGYSNTRTPENKQLKRKSLIYSYTKLHHMLNKEMVCKYNDPQFLCNFASSYHLNRQIVRSDVYGDPKYIEFEDGLFPVPKKAEVLLEKIYGEYMRLPVVRNRTAHHRFYDSQSIVNIVETKTAEDKALLQLEIDEIKQIRKLEIEILKEVDRLCKNEALAYYLAEDTLLEAARSGSYSYNGNDIKIMLMRDDYDRLIELCQTQLNEEYTLLYYTCTNNYGAIVPRIRKKETGGFTQKKAAVYTSFTGPYVSIYPLDVALKSKKETKKQKESIEELRTALKYRVSETPPRDLNDKKIIEQYADISVQELHQKVQAEAKKFNDKNSPLLCNYLIRKNPEKVLFPKKAFEDISYLQIEGDAFPVPIGYDEVLTIGFGDYKNNESKVNTVRHTFE